MEQIYIFYVFSLQEIGFFVMIQDKYEKEFAFLGLSTKLRKATISFVISVRSSAWNSSAPNGRIFMKFEI